MAASREPQQVSAHDWFYEFPTYMLFVHEVRDEDGGHLRTDQIKIPWRMIQPSLKRAYKPRKR